MKCFISTLIFLVSGVNKALNFRSSVQISIERIDHDICRSGLHSVAVQKQSRRGFSVTRLQLLLTHISVTLCTSSDTFQIKAVYDIVQLCSSAKYSRSKHPCQKNFIKCYLCRKRLIFLIPQSDRPLNRVTNTLGGLRGRKGQPAFHRKTLQEVWVHQS